MILDKQKYPIGIYIQPEIITKEILQNWINDISIFPESLKKETIGLTDEQLNTSYRENGWTIRQVVHHCADSHINSLTRLKLALTEEQPTIKPYYEEKWAELKDSKQLPLEPSFRILEGIHEKWSFLLNNLRVDELKRTFFHPESKKIFSIEENIGLYAWHCKHHLAHITELKKRNNW